LYCSSGGEADLCSEQGLARAYAAGACAVRARGLLQKFEQVMVAEGERRHESGEHAAEGGEREDEEQHDAVEVDGVGACELDWRVGEP
jgi:hypothetical protein